MEKELEEIRDDKLRIGLLGLKRLFETNKEKISKDEIMAFDFTFMNITKALTELQAIKEVKPSEALKWLEKYKPTILFNTTVVENALLKAQEQEKENGEYKEVLRIVFEKNVDIHLLVISDDLNFYNVCIEDRLPLTQEEFDLLKRWCEKCQKKS